MENNTSHEISLQTSTTTTTTKKKELDPDYYSCLLQPSNPDSDPNYVGIRRLLLYNKAASGIDIRKDWECNGRAYVAYRNYIRRPRNWESSRIPSQASTPGNSGRWASSPAPLFFDVDSWSSSRDLRSCNPTLTHRASFSSSVSDADRRPIRFNEPAYTFVGMHCIFDSCKVSVTVLKFGHTSSDLLAYGASDGSLTVCTVSQPPKILQQLKGHSKDVTGLK